MKNELGVLCFNVAVYRCSHLWLPSTLNTGTKEIFQSEAHKG